MTAAWDGGFFRFNSLATYLSCARLDPRIIRSLRQHTPRIQALAATTTIRYEKPVNQTASKRELRLKSSRDTALSTTTSHSATGGHWFHYGIGIRFRRRAADSTTRCCCQRRWPRKLICSSANHFLIDSGQAKYQSRARIRIARSIACPCACPCQCRTLSSCRQWS